MRIAILGATGCVGRNLVKKLIQSDGHDVVASYRYEGKIDKSISDNRIEWRKVDLQSPESVMGFLAGTEALVYLVHSLASAEFESLDRILAHKVADVAQKSSIKKIIYLSGIIPKGTRLSPHLKSRQETGISLAAHGIPVGEVRASILLGTCSASYRIVYYLAKRLPLMVTPKWLNSLCAPIALKDAVDAIESLLTRDIENHEIFEIGSDVMRYRDLLSLCGKTTHGYSNAVVTVPFFAISLSSLWIELVTGISNTVARALAESLINDSVFSHNRFKEITGRDPMPVEQALYECAKEMKREHKEKVLSSVKKKG
ncbi:MAG: NAD(P)H-binding protein [Candidatus Brocadiaceae bacterium]|nr:NAD(P)H-binding protein [Candidatus Brocadiaceae bacterium]